MLQDCIWIYLLLYFVFCFKAGWRWRVETDVAVPWLVSHKGPSTYQPPSLLSTIYQVLKMARKERKKERVPKNTIGGVSLQLFIVINKFVFTLVTLIIDITNFQPILWSSRARISGRFPDITRGVPVQNSVAGLPSERISSLPDFDQRMSQAFVTLQCNVAWLDNCTSSLPIIFPKRKTELPPFLARFWSAEDVAGFHHPTTFHGMALPAVSRSLSINRKMLQALVGSSLWFGLVHLAGTCWIVFFQSFSIANKSSGQNYCKGLQRMKDG